MSVILNLTTAVLAVGAVTVHMRRSPWKIVLRYFTILSNLFCAAASLCVAVMRLLGERWIIVLFCKYIATVAVTVTLLTVFLFLYRIYGFKALLTGPDLLLHLICPGLSLVSYYVWDRIEMSPAAALLGTSSVAVYGVLYMRKVVVEKKWEDFYGFNRGGQWKISFCAMMASTAMLCIIMWLSTVGGI